MARLRHLYYYAYDEYDCDDSYPMFYFRNLRTAIRTLGKPHSVGFVIKLASRIAGKRSSRTEAIWVVDEKGAVVRTSRNYCRAMHRSATTWRSTRRFTLTLDGKPYSPPPNPDDPNDIPF